MNAARTTAPSSLDDQRVLSAVHAPGVAHTLTLSSGREWNRARLVACAYAQRPVSQRLSHVGPGDAIRVIEVGDGACDLEHAMVGARREARSFRGGREQLARVGVDWCAGIEPAPGDVRVASHAGMMAVSLALSRPGVFDALTHRGGRFAALVRTKRAQRHGSQSDLHVDAIGEGAGQSRLMVRDLRCGARAAAVRITGAPAGTWIHRADERELRWEHHGGCRTRDDDAPVLERLAQGIKDVAWDLLQLVEKQDAVMREAYLARPRITAAANESGGRQGVVRRPKWSRDGDGGVRREQPRDGVNRDDFERFFFCESRQDRGQAAREHRLPRTGRTDHEQRVGAGRRDLERALGDVLADDVGKVHDVHPGLARGGLRRTGAVESTEMQLQNDVVERRRRGYRKPGDERGFANVRRRKDECDVHLVALDTPPVSSKTSSDRQGAANGAQRSVEAQLSDRNDRLECRGVELSGGSEEA